jgi:hypothetical protein
MRGWTADVRQAEELVSDLNIQSTSRFAIDIDADFQFDGTDSADADSLDVQNEKRSSSNTLVEEKEGVQKVAPDLPFALNDVLLRVPRGRLRFVDHQPEVTSKGHWSVSLVEWGLANRRYWRA